MVTLKVEFTAKLKVEFAQVCYLKMLKVMLWFNGFFYGVKLNKY